MTKDVKPDDSEHDEQVTPEPPKFRGMITEIANGDTDHQNPATPYQRYKVAEMPIEVHIEPGLPFKRRLYLRVRRVLNGALANSAITTLTIPFVRQVDLQLIYYGDIETNTTGVVLGPKYFELFEDSGFTVPFARSWVNGSGGYTHFNDDVRFEIVNGP